MNKMSSKLSYYAIIFIMGAIIVSFVLTGFQGFGNNPDQVANVDGRTVTLDEFNRNYNMQISRYGQMLGGKALTSQQIKMFRIRESVLNSLISQKHLVNFADNLGFDAGKKAIKAEIMNYKAFESNGQFDVTKYKNLLRANNLSPATFEETLIDDIKMKNLRDLVGAIAPSQNALKADIHLRSIATESTVVSFQKEEMTKNLDVSKKEIKEFVADKKNDSLLQALYKSYKSEEENKKTKKISTFDQKKNELAKAHIQKSKRDELAAFNKELQEKIKTALAANKTKELKKLQKAYGITLEQKAKITPLNPQVKNIKFNKDEVLKLFTNKDKKTIVVEDSDTSVAFLKVNSFMETEIKNIKEEELTKELAAAKTKNAQAIENAIIDYQNDHSKVTTNLPVM